MYHAEEAAKYHAAEHSEYIGLGFDADVKRGLVVGIANVHSIAYGCAEAFHGEGAELAMTYLNTKVELKCGRSAKRLKSDHRSMRRA